VSEPVALALTLVIELPVWIVLLGARLAVPWTWATVVGVAANAVSHPLLWFVMIPLGEGATGSTVVAIAIGEAVVVVVEAALGAAILHRAGAGRRDHRAREVAVVALLANVLSVAAGIVLGALGLGT